MGNRKNYEQIANSLGFEEIPSNNKYMWSYRNDGTEQRINYYFGKGTVTIQKEGVRIKVFRDVLTDLDFEKILSDNI